MNFRKIFTKAPSMYKNLENSSIFNFTKAKLAFQKIYNYEFEFLRQKLAQRILFS